MDVSVIAAWIAAGGVVVAAILGFWGVRVQSARQIQAALITQSDDDTKRAELAVSVASVDVERTKVVVGGFEHLVEFYRDGFDQCQQEVERLKEKHAAELKRIAREEIEPRDRLILAHRKGEDEHFFQVGLFAEMKREIITKARAVIRERADLQVLSTQLLVERQRLERWEAELDRRSRGD